MRKSLFFLLSILYVIEIHGQTILVSTIPGDLFQLNVENCTYQYLTTIQQEVFDISFHPNRKLYGIAPIGGLYEVSLTDGAVNLVHTFNDSEQAFNSLTISGDGIIYTTGDKGELYSYHISTEEEIFHGAIGYWATGDLTFFNGDLYMAASNDEIILIDLDNPPNSTVAISGNISGAIFGIVSFAKSCSDINSYAIAGSESPIGNSMSSIYVINYEFKRLGLICTTDLAITGSASTFEYFASAPIMIDTIAEVNPSCKENDGAIAIEASGGVGELIYSINRTPFQSNGSFDNLMEGSYNIEIKDDNNCSISEEVELVTPNSIRIEGLSTTQPICGKEEGGISIVASGGTGQLTYSLDAMNYQITSSFQDLLADTYNMTILDEAECSVDTLVTIQQEKCPIYLPNAFSPNNDGINDFFTIIPHPQFTGSFQTFKIFNRWGDLIFNTSASDPKNTTWDGKFKNKLMPNGVYVYFLEVLHQDNSLELFSGDLTLTKH